MTRDSAEQILAVGSLSGELALLRLSSGEVIARRDEAHQEAVEAVSCSPDGKLLASGSKDRTIKLWRVADSRFEEILTLRSPTGPIHAVRFSPDGHRLYTVARGEPAVRLRQLAYLPTRLKQLKLDWE